MLLGGAAAYVILSIAERMRATEQGSFKVRWLTVGAVAGGLEIWAIHFTGNLAFCPPIPAAQDVGLAIISILSAVVAGALAVYLISTHDGNRLTLMSGGLIMGACLMVTHFTSLMAIHQVADVQQDLTLFIFSVTAMVGLGIFVLLVGGWNIQYGDWRVTEKASAMGVALSASHLAGMIPSYRPSDGCFTAGNRS